MNDTVWNHSGAPYHRLEPAAMAFLEINAQTPRNKPPHNNPEIIINNIQFQLNPEQESNNNPQKEKSATAWTRRRKGMSKISVWKRRTFIIRQRKMHGLLIALCSRGRKIERSNGWTGWLLMIICIIFSLFLDKNHDKIFF